MPDRAFDVDDRRGTEEALLAAIGLLRHRRVQANDGGHGHDPGGVLRHMVTYDAANLGMWVLCFSVIEFALARGRLLAGTNRFKYTMQKKGQLTCAMGPPSASE